MFRQSRSVVRAWRASRDRNSRSYISISIELFPEVLAVERFHQMNDSQFHRAMERAARIHQSATIDLLHFINELDRRKSFLDLGYSSVYDYCTRKLEYSSSTAGRLIQAARCVRRHPEVLRMLQAREMSISTICLIEPILDEKNKRLLLERVRGASRRDVERIACEYRPPVAFRDRITPVRVATASGTQNMVLVQFLASDAFAMVFNEVRDLQSACQRTKLR